MATLCLRFALPISSLSSPKRSLFYARPFPAFASDRKSSLCSETSTPSSSRWAASPRKRDSSVAVACLPSSSPKATRPSSTRLFVSGLSFNTTEESLRNAFQIFGELTEVNLVMNRIANRSRGFAFLRYNTEEESKKAIEGMHGKFLDGRVIFVEVAKPKSELRQNSKPASGRFY
ncbi:hypothetical protein HPP92_002398 [Vanilla planifolia]|uniref:RRM domain-containing protein n=1 Tax=Vanilla planifolia TaxID=51239 RepID=A0A835VG94_VANPL|nr:hypothetical protein HPP92_002398 [Vanilla planifolia]